MKGTTQKKNLPPQAVRDIKKPSQLQNNIKKYDTKNQKLKKAEANLALKKQRDHLTAGQTCKKTILPAKCEGKKVEVSQKPVTCQFEKGDSLHVPQNSFASLGENVEKCHPMNLPKKSCHYCKTIFEFLEKKSKDPDCEPPKEYLQRVDDCPLCCKFLEFLKLQCKTCCGKCRSKFDHCCGCNRSADKQRPKTESKAHRPKLTIEQIKAIEMKENKIIYDKIFNKPRPKTAEGSCRKSPSRNNRQTQIPIVSPVEENVRRNLEKLLKQISEMSNNETKRSKINSQAEIEERVKPLKLSETCTDVTDASSYMSADDAFINANGETFCPSDCLCQRQRNSEKQHRCIQVAPIPPPVDFEWTVKPCRTTRKNSFETKRPYTAIDKTQHRQLIEELDSYHACRNSKLNTSFYEEELYSDYSGSILSNN